MQVYNHTPFTEHEISKMPFIGKADLKWRSRIVMLYSAPDGKIISVGTTYDNTMKVIATETTAEWTDALEFFDWHKNEMFTIY